MGPSLQNAAEPPLESFPADAQALINQYEKDRQPILREARRKIRELQTPLIASLKQLQDRYTRDAKLDEAVAIRDCLRTLQESRFRILPDPGRLYRYNMQVGQTFYFRVTGSRSGSLWGTDVYTLDSTLAVAAVHAGVLQPGQTGVVKVTILPGQSSYQGSNRHGLQSSSWGGYPASFKVESASDEEEIEADDQAQPAPPAVPEEENDPFQEGAPILESQ